MSEFDESHSAPQGDTDAFARLFASHQRMLFGYLVTALGGTADADDVFQETCVVIWREREKFEMGTNFAGWATAIALNQVRRFRRQNRSRATTVAPEVLEQVAAEGEWTPEGNETVRRALAVCIEGLSAEDRDLIQRVYGGQATIKDVAEDLNRPVNTVYKWTARVRRRLQECIVRRLAQEDRS